MGQATLPLRFGGLGLPNHVSISPLAFTAASLLASDTIIALSLINPTVDISCTDHLRPLSNTTQKPIPLSSSTLLSQRELSGLQHKQSFTRLIGRLPKRHRARLLSSSQTGSGLFLTAIPSGHNIMTPITFSTALSYRLGQTPCPDQQRPLQQLSRIDRNRWFPCCSVQILHQPSPQCPRQAHRSVHFRMRLPYNVRSPAPFPQRRSKSRTSPR